MVDYIQHPDVDFRHQNVLELVSQIPASNLANYMFKNRGTAFEKVAAQWGLDQASNSNGAVYADLDNDGDLDLIVNNIDLPAFIYRNEANSHLDHHYLKIKLEGERGNTQGLGAKITIYHEGKLQYLEQMPTRGYQSSVSPTLHAGLGSSTEVDSLKVVWIGGNEELLTKIEADQVLVLREINATSPTQPPKATKPLYTEVPSPVQSPQPGNNINDFKRQPLLVNPLSFSTPIMIQADINGDGLEDIFVGTSAGHPGQLFLQMSNGSFVQKPIPDFEVDKGSEDTGAVFFDANGDGFPDLYVNSGGYGNFLPEDPLLQDRLYLNDGRGNFTKSVDALPKMLTSSSTVQASDIDGDGHIDLFVGGRVVPGRYPETPRTYLLINDGTGKFTDKTSDLADSLEYIGMVTDAKWIDLNGDGTEDLIVVGEWMPITIFLNEGGRLNDRTLDYFDKAYRGWWNKLMVDDINGDGRPDMVVGNQGLNTQVVASDEEPATMLYKDFDGNGAVDPILSFYIQGTSYPYVTRDELLDQIAMMRTRFTNYESYADATLEDIFSTEELEGAGYLEANFLKTAYFESNATGKFKEKPLPLQAQSSPIFAINAIDVDGDGNKDLLLAGNIEQARLRFGKYDANYGMLLKGDGKGNFTYIPQWQSGFKINGDVRSILNMGDKLLFGINQRGVVAYQKAAGQ